MLNEEQISFAFLQELENGNQGEYADFYYESENQVELTPYIDLFFPFIISQEHRLSEQAVVLSGGSIQHNRKKAVLKQFDLQNDQKGFKKELEVIAEILLFNDDMEKAGLPELMGFAFGQVQSRAELMMSHCGHDLNQEWDKYMVNRGKAKSIELKLKVCDMARQVLHALNCLHRVGFCHWDLKLDNICFNQGHFYLIDFALSQRIKATRKNKVVFLKGNSMFASMRKFNMETQAFPIDDIESLLYLVCFSYDEFYLPWFQDYINQKNTQHFITLRQQNADHYMRYLYQNMPKQISKALHYIAKLNEKHAAYQKKYEKYHAQPQILQK